MKFNVYSEGRGLNSCLYFSIHISLAAGADGVGGVRHQDQQCLNRVYATIDKWRRAVGVAETILPTGLEPIVQSAGHIWKHSQHKGVNKKANGKIK